eukprot:TRINITY_DN102891_c0_g1_i1.p1 TRINITY_DN102891_c0_g1~~TRINITY_DN102891_c0_g1_i1.p1  ORF type:complete len:315 (-),score=29.70 TRINITY_DN102891_c0_g1_i1:101-1015(-)
MLALVLEYLFYVWVLLFAKLLVRLKGTNPIRQLSQRLLYDYFGWLGLRGGKFATFSTLNYGTTVAPPEEPPKHLQWGEADKRALAMYWYTATSHGTRNLEDLRILEVGSGRGGGAAYITQVFKPRLFVGVELSQPALKYGIQKYKSTTPNLFFMQGRAEDLPVPSQSFDMLLNIESSHLYNPITDFLKEAHRVLIPGGSLVISDFRLCVKGQLANLEEFQGLLRGCKGFKLLENTDITENVIDSKNKRNKEVNDLISSAPKWAHSSLHTFYGSTQGRLYQAFTNKWAQYRHWVLERTEEEFALP